MIQLTEIFMFCFSHVGIKKNAQGVGCHPCTLSITPLACFSMYVCLAFCLSASIWIYPGIPWYNRVVYKHGMWTVYAGMRAGLYALGYYGNALTLRMATTWDTRPRSHYCRLGNDLQLLLVCWMRESWLGREGILSWLLVAFCLSTEARPQTRH